MAWRIAVALGLASIQVAFAADPAFAAASPMLRTA
ncbi:hypothetical protein M2171_007607 [Bradyrhizobium japonicum USDA 38]|nr:hypothetical protein [Bradyrhizobium japonicum USDA 38]MCS3941527.1 hypothetical protein [Bradyrhizobium japonicum]